MYVSRGRTVRISDASKYPLVEAIREAIRLGDARVIYYAPGNAVFYIEVARNGRAGCIAVIGSRRVEGVECLEELKKRLPGNEGTIELVQLDPERVRVDLLSNPMSILPMGRRDLEEAIAPRREERVEAREKPAAQPQLPAAAPQAAQPAPAPSPAPIAAAPAAEAAPAAVPAGPVVVSPVVSALLASLERRGLRLREVFDVAAATVTVAAGREVEAAAPGRRCTDILADISSFARHVFLECIGQGRRILARLDTGAGAAEVLYFDEESGRGLTGRAALEEASRVTAQTVRVFIR